MGDSRRTGKAEGNPDPEPGTTAGLDAGGAVPTGETPPAEGGISASGPRETHNPVRGWAALPLLAVVVVAAAMVGFFLAYAVILAL